MTIVCVDDHPVMLRGLTQNIKQMLPEADMHTFESADKALLFLKDHACDVLICEIELGGTNGLTLARQAKELNPMINIIFLTVCDETEYAHEVFDIRPSGYLVKPAGNEQLEYELKHLRYGAGCVATASNMC